MLSCSWIQARWTRGRDNIEKSLLGRSWLSRLVVAAAIMVVVVAAMVLAATVVVVLTVMA